MTYRYLIAILLLLPFGLEAQNMYFSSFKEKYVDVLNELILFDRSYITEMETNKHIELTRKKETYQYFFNNEKLYRVIMYRTFNRKNRARRAFNHLRRHLNRTSDRLIIDSKGNRLIGLRDARIITVRIVQTFDGPAVTIDHRYSPLSPPELHNGFDFLLKGESRGNEQFTGNSRAKGRI